MKKAKENLWQIAVLGVLSIAIFASMVVPESWLLPKRQQREISVLIRQQDSTLWSICRQGMEQAAEDYGVELRFLTLSENNNPVEQAELMKREKEVGIDAMIVAPADREKISLCVEQMGQLPVIAMESPLEGAKAWVGPDNQQVGKLLAEQILQNVSPSALVLLVDGGAECAALQQRMEQMEQSLSEKGCLVQNCTFPTTEQLRQAEAVVCMDAQTVQQIVQMVPTDAPTPILYGAGMTDSLVIALENGQVQTLAVWSEYAMGYVAVQQAAAAAQNQKVKDYPLPVSVVQEGETYEPINQKLLYPVSH